MEMQRKILIPIDPVPVVEDIESTERSDDEYSFGIILTVVVWAFVFTHYSFNPIQFLIDFMRVEIAQSGLFVNVFALIGLMFTLQSLPWGEILEQICRLHLRLFIGFPWAVVVSLLKCIMDIAHSYWCVFAPQSTVMNPDYKFLEHPMERK
jgi:hypothetical protein